MSFRSIFGVRWSRFMKIFLLGWAFVEGLLLLLYLLLPWMVL